MILREAERTVRKLSKGYPVIAITGPRQSGKTTLARYVFNKKPYVSLENPDIRELAQGDPRGFLEKYRIGGVFEVMASSVNSQAVDADHTIWVISHVDNKSRN